jgi:predicted Zn-dependent protease
VARREKWFGYAFGQTDMTKKRRRKQAARKFPNSQTVQVVTYEITDAPILDREYRRLPQEVKEAINRLHDLSQRRPREAIPELLEWIAHYPDVPVFYNYLSAAYSLSGQRDKAEAAIEDNYQRVFVNRKQVHLITENRATRAICRKP